MKDFWKKILEKWSNLSQKRKFFWSAFLSLVFLIIIIPFSVKAGLLTAVASLIGSVLSALINVIGALITLLLQILIKFFQFNHFLDITAVREGWRLVRDVCNMFFIVVLLIISFATILKIESYAYKKWLGKLVVAAILINFSKTITGFLIGISQVVMLTFVSAFKDAVAGNIAHGLHLDKMLSASKDGEFMEGNSDLTDAGVIMGTLLLAFILLLVMSVVLLIMAVVLVGRIVTLWVLVILSPLAFIFQASPFGSKYAKQWWGELGKNLVAGPVLAFFLWLALLTIQRSSEGVAQDLYNQEHGLNEGNSLSGTGPAFVSDISKLGNLMDYIVTIALLIAAIKVTQQLGVAGSSFAGKMQQNLGQWGKKALKGSTVGLAGYLDRKQATVTGIQFSKIPGNIKEGLRLRKEEEERGIRAKAGKLADNNSGPLSILQGYTAGPEAAKKMWFTGFLGLKGIAKTARVAFGSKGAYRKVMDRGEDKSEDLKKKKEEAEQIQLVLSFKDKAEKAGIMLADIQKLDDRNNEIEEEQENEDLSTEEYQALEDEKKENERKKEEKVREFSDFMKNSKVLEDGVGAEIAMNNFDAQAQNEGDTLYEIIQAENKKIDSNYDSQIKKVEEEETDKDVKKAKIARIEAEREFKKAEIGQQFQLNKDDNSKIRIAGENLKTAEIDLLDKQVEKGIVSSEEREVTKKRIEENFEQGKGLYEKNNKGERHGRFLDEMGTSLIDSVKYSESQGEISHAEAKEKIAEIKSQYNSVDGTIKKQLKEKLSKEEEIKGKIRDKQIPERDQIKKSRRNINNNKNKVVDSLNSFKISDLKKQAQEMGIKVEGDSLDEIKQNINIALDKATEQEKNPGLYGLNKAEAQGKRENIESLLEKANGISEIDKNASIDDLIKTINSSLENKDLSKTEKDGLTKEKTKLEKLKISEKENNDKVEKLDLQIEQEYKEGQQRDSANLTLKGLGDAAELLKNSLKGLAKKVEKISMPKSLSARIAERSLVEEKKKEFSGIDDADELLSYLRSAVDNKETYKVRALLEKMASDGNDNEFLNDYGYTSNAIGMEQFRRDILRGELKMDEQGSLQVLNDIGYINEKIGHWETARLVSTDKTGKMSPKITQRPDGSWNDTLHAIECLTEITKMNGRAVLNNLNRLAYGGEVPQSDGSRTFQLSNLGKMIITMLSNDKHLMAKRGNELNVNAAQNFMSPSARQEIANLLGEKSQTYQLFYEVSGLDNGIRSHYKDILDHLKRTGNWSDNKI